MSLFDCLETAIGAGEMDAARGRDAQAVYAGLLRRYRASLGDEAAAAQAAADTRRIMGERLAETRRRRLLELATRQRILSDLDSYKGGADAPGQAVAALIDRDDLAPYANVEGRRHALRGLYHAGIESILARAKRTIGGKSGDPEWLRKIVRELFGEDSGDAGAKAAADAWSRTAETARQNFNMAGGQVGKLEGWGLPQSHDSMAVRQAGRDAWVSFVRPLLDADRMKARIADGVFSGIEPGPQGVLDLDAELRDGLAAAYENIATDGWASREPSGAIAGRSLANRHADRRFLIFKDAESWLAYQDRFGTDPFDAMMSHIDVMARDTALLQVLGPNPDATLRWLDQRTRKAAAERDAAEGGRKWSERADRSMKLVDDMIGLYTGETTRPVGGAVARFFMGLRQGLQAVQLGSASLSAIGDLNTQRIAASDAGLSQGRLIKRLLSQLNPASAEDRIVAVRAGLIAENWSQMAAAQQRYVGETVGPEWSRILSDAVMRVSFLSPWTQAGRWAFGMEFMGTLADHAGRAFAELPAPLARTLERYGLDAAAWDKVRAAPLYDHKGAKFLRPDDVGDQALGLRLLEMIQAETEFAVPSTSLRGRATFLGDARPGTFGGELLRSTLMYKNFSITFWQNNLRRLWLRPGWVSRGAGAVNLAVGGMLMGALALELKQIAAGRDPRPMDTAGFWGAALMQGSGVGIFGDFLFSDLNRFGGGLPETLAGPVAGFGKDVVDLTAGNVAQVLAGKDANVGRDLTRFLRLYTPGSSLWYARLAFDRLVFDQLQYLADPKAAEDFRRKEQRWKTEFGQRFYWRPGQSLPERAPDLTAIGASRR